MAELKKIKLNPVQLTIEPKTHLLILKQGNSEVKITRDSVINMRKLRNGVFEDNCFTSQITPRNKFTMSENGTITIVCKDDIMTDAVIITKHRKLDDLERVENYVEHHKPYIAWERDFKRKRRY